MKKWRVVFEIVTALRDNLAQPYCLENVSLVTRDDLASNRAPIDYEGAVPSLAGTAAFIVAADDVDKAIMAAIGFAQRTQLEADFEAVRIAVENDPTRGRVEAQAALLRIRRRNLR